ncbi:hypothetical protein VP01_2365g1 [Puccinia sorghi]|uniref:Uncharacterized protein n=1 Tax=Puccinia sorghi TaxID=27349 RepID=A0A0L6V761_9BASI|nr:hypothetical protein VP01_2365g1 [Puccinia sorghi]
MRTIHYIFDNRWNWIVLISVEIPGLAMVCCISQIGPGITVYPRFHHLWSRLSLLAHGYAWLGYLQVSITYCCIRSQLVVLMLNLPFWASRCLALASASITTVATWFLKSLLVFRRSFIIGDLTCSPPTLDPRPTGLFSAGPGGLRNQFSIAKNWMILFFQKKKKLTPGFLNVEFNKSPVFGGITIFLFGLFPRETLCLKLPNLWEKKIKMTKIHCFSIRKKCIQKARCSTKNINFFFWRNEFDHLIPHPKNFSYRNHYHQICCNLTPKKINEQRFHILGIRPATPICILKICSVTYCGLRIPSGGSCLKPPSEFMCKIMGTEHVNQKIQQKKVAIQIFCALIENTDGCPKPTMIFLIHCINF